MSHERRFRVEEWFDVALHVGLAGVFIVNALIAWLQPDDFVDLVRHSALAGLFPVEPGRWLAWAICLNDVLLGTPARRDDPRRTEPGRRARVVGRLAPFGHRHQDDVARSVHDLTEQRRRQRSTANGAARDGGRHYVAGMSEPTIAVRELVKSFDVPVREPGPQGGVAQPDPPHRRAR